jgi:hypothetical protein
MSVVEIVKESLPSWAAGDGTVGTTPAKLGSLPVLKHVIVRANGGNGSDKVMVGHSAAAAAAGFVLASGVRSPPIYVDDLAKVWVVGTSGVTDPILTKDDSLLTNGVDPAVITITSTNKVFHVTFTADGGTYVLTLNGVPTASIAFGANATAVASAINTAAGATVVSVTGTPGSFDITYLGGQGYSWIAN